MSERALGFVDEWISAHLAPEGDASEPGPADAKALARQCLADAAAAGIPESEIAESIDDLTAFMAGAIAEAQEREAHREANDNG